MTTPNNTSTGPPPEMATAQRAWLRMAMSRDASEKFLRDKVPIIEPLSSPASVQAPPPPPRFLSGTESITHTPC